jgi:hypothetical protein
VHAYADRFVIRQDGEIAADSASLRPRSDERQV